MSRGLFVAVEGLGGLGKTTLADALTDDLRSKGYEVLRTREPGGTYGAEILREMLRGGKLDDGEDEINKFSAMGNALLFNAARIDHVEKVIRPAIQAGKVVICDRFCDSTIAIQSVQSGIDPNHFVDLHAMAVTFWPDITILLDGSAELSNSRLSPEEINSDKFDRFKVEEKNKIASVHRWLASRNKPATFGDYSIISSTEPVEEVQRIAFAAVECVAQRKGAVNFPIGRNRLKELTEVYDPELLSILSTSQLSVAQIVEALKDASKRVPVTK